MSDGTTVDRATIVSNLVGYCKGSKIRTAILKAVRTKKFYTAVAREVGTNPTTVSNVLNQMKPLGLVVGKLGSFEQSRTVKGINIDSELRRFVGVLHKSSTSKSPRYKVEKLTVRNFAEALDYSRVDPVIQKDCFPLKRPYRMRVGEAYLTLENVIKDELNLPSTLIGMDVVREAAKKGLFKRDDGGEEQGLTQLFNASVMWLRNPAHHYKEDFPRSDALKMILFADYLIKLVRRQKKLNKIAG